MARMQNDPKQQPSVLYDVAVKNAKDDLARIRNRGQRSEGKYQKKRLAEVLGHETTLSILEQLRRPNYRILKKTFIFFLFTSSKFSLSLSLSLSLTHTIPRISLLQQRKESVEVDELRRRTATAYP